MTREEALGLLKQYRDAHLCDSRYTHMGRVSAQMMRHALDMAVRFPENGSESKAMRWLGHLQGCLRFAHWYSLEELKTHSKNKTLAPKSPCTLPLVLLDRSDACGACGNPAGEHRNWIREQERTEK